MLAPLRLAVAPALALAGGAFLYLGRGATRAEAILGVEAPRRWGALEHALEERIGWRGRGRAARGDSGRALVHPVVVARRIVVVVRLVEHEVAQGELFRDRVAELAHVARPARLFPSREDLRRDRDALA